MLDTIQFDDQADLVAGEIGKIPTDRDLPAKVRAFDRDLPEMAPKPGFGIRRGVSQATRVGGFEALEFCGFFLCHAPPHQSVRSMQSPPPAASRRPPPSRGR
jgi:hypothetical protein